jgi:hypothetical protein
MTATIQHIVTCPVCQSDEFIHHDVRASLVYSCRNCSHEWQISPADEPPAGDPAVVEPATMPPAGDTAVVEPPRMPPAGAKRPRKR